MAYITLQELKDRIGTTLYARLTDRVNGAAADDAVGQQLVDQAEAEANSRLAARYATPIDVAANPEVGESLAARVLDFAEALAWQSTPFVNDLPDRVRLLREAAERWFADVARGVVLLPGARALATSVTANDAASYSARARVFTSEELEGL